nr:hypothetical protein [Rhodococcus sp. (in: high G+C Gram-positive bacteria)]
MRNWILGIAAVGMLAGCSSDTGSEPQPAPDTTVRAAPSAEAPTTTQSSTPIAAPTVAPQGRSATEVGCSDADQSLIDAITADITEGRVLRDIAAVTTVVDGDERTYLSANVFRADGDRSVSAAVWFSPGDGVYNLSGNSRDVTPSFAFARGEFGGVNAGDEFGQQAQDCVSAIAQGR